MPQEVLGLKQNQSNKITAAKLSQLVAGSLVGNSQLMISRATGIKESKSESVVFAENEEYLRAAFASEAALLILPLKFSNHELLKSPVKSVILVENPRLAYAKIADLFSKKPYAGNGISEQAMIADSAKLGRNISIHPGVVIGERSEIADNVILAPGVIIGPDVVIGENSLLHPGVVVERESILGADLIIQANSVIGSDGYGYVTAEDGHHKIPQNGNVIIEDQVEIGANVTVDRGTSGPTVIGRGSKIDNLVQIAHNVKIGPECLIVAQAGIAGSSSLAKRVTLAGQVGVIGHLEIKENSTIAAKSLVTNDIPEGVFYSGNPAQNHQQELRTQAASRKLPELLKRVRELEKELEKLTKN